MTETQTKQVEQAADARDRPSVIGYVDAVTGTRLFGWAWDPRHPATRIALRVEIRGRADLTLVADKLREDLRANGVGDGAHAFEAVLLDGVQSADIRVLAVCPETGETVTLPSRDAEAVTGVGFAALREPFQALARSHRLLHRNVNSMMIAIETLRRDQATLDPGGAKHGSEAQPAEIGPEPLLAQLQTIDEALYRIDHTLCEQVGVTRSMRRDGHDLVARLLAGAAAALAAANLLVLVMR
jgi:hypothetical protein